MILIRELSTIFSVEASGVSCCNGSKRARIFGGEVRGEALGSGLTPDAIAKV